MKIKCIKLTVDKISYGINEDMINYLTIGDTYVVYGLRFSNEHIYAYIYNNEHLFETPLELFTIIDSKVSTEWRVFSQKNKEITIWPELFYKENFLENFSEREFEERRLFDDLCRKIEFT